MLADFRKTIATGAGRLLLTTFTVLFVPGIGVWVLAATEGLSMTEKFVMWCAVVALTGIGLYAGLAAIERFILGTDKQRIAQYLSDLRSTGTTEQRISWLACIWANADDTRGPTANLYFKILKAATKTGEITVLRQEKANDVVTGEEYMVQIASLDEFESFLRKRGVI